MNAKKYAGLAQLLVLIALGGLVIFSLAVPVLPFTAAKPLPKEISVLMREEDSAFWSNMRLGMEQAAYDMGGQLRFLTPDMQNSHVAQNDLLLREIEGGTDALVIIPANPSALEATLAKASELPVVSIESPLSQDSLCITPDNVALGEALANACLPTTQTVLLLDTASESTGVRSRLKSCAAALKAENVNVVTAQADAATLAEKLPALLLQHGANSVIAFEHSATEALAAGAKNAPKAALYGVGGTGPIVAALENGSLQRVAVWSDYAVGYLAVQAAIGASENKKIASIPFVKFRIVKGADIYETSNQKLLFPVVN